MPAVPIQDEWLENRKAFDGQQQHFVAERGSSVVGYAAVERRHDDAPATFRLFVVVDWRSDLAVAETLYDRASTELSRFGARRAWLREYASDRAVIDFAESRGFGIVQEYDREGERLVTLAKDLD